MKKRLLSTSISTLLLGLSVMPALEGANKFLI